MREVVSEIEVLAPVERVWEVLLDFAAYADWNPYLRRVAGTPTPGARLEIEVARAGGKVSTFNVVVLAGEESRRLAWRSAILAPFLFEIRHQLELEPLSKRRARLTQRERLSGLLAPFGARSLEHARHSFHEMNLALKRRAEATVPEFRRRDTR